MIKFEDKYVHFRWSEKLIGKKCFVADTLESLEIRFQQGKQSIISRKHDNIFPFETAQSWYQLCYYDPNYEAKVAYSEGRQIQVKHCEAWYDISNPTWDDDSEYRIKPYESSLQWTDLDVGDIIETFKDGHCKAMVTCIDYDSENNLHIYACYWLKDEDLKNWKKI